MLIHQVLVAFVMRDGRFENSDRRTRSNDVNRIKKNRKGDALGK